MEEAPAASPTEKPVFQIEAKNGLFCPECSSKRLYKDGLRYLADGSAVQRYLCRDCGYRFSWPRAERLRQHGGKNLKSEHGLTFNRCSSRALALLERSVERAMNEQKENGQWAAGATGQTLDGAKIKEIIINFVWWMRKQGYAESTIERRSKVLEVLAKRGANLYDPESVKETLARQKWDENSKNVAVKAYNTFLKMVGGSWTPPKTRPAEKLPFIPTEEELNSLIAASNGKLAAFLMLLKETGMRAGEAHNLQWKDVDFENGTVRVTPEKGSNPRIFKLSPKLLAMLNQMKKTNEWVFKPWQLKHMRRTFQRIRNRLAFKLCNPRLKLITLHTFRHWKATMEYAKTKDILYVMRLLGHKNIKNTLKYTQLVNFKDDEYHFATAKTIEEAGKLIEAGFEYVCHHEGTMLFRKRK
ncbi:MAG: tyrosine-type recombinase/integrase [Candidatus Bathyarchaeia archaeon]